MTVFAELKAEGWHLSNEGFELCSENIHKLTVSSVIKKALDMDLRDIGGGFLPDDVTKGKADSILGPGVLQIQKVKNASAPKYEYGSGAPPILRLLLTDGNSYINCLQWGTWKSISMETPPGTKIYLKPVKIPMQNNFLLLSEHQFSVLGGCVASMVEKWELNRQLASHIRTKENLDGSGPPPWIPFGQPIISSKPLKSTNNFRALEPDTKDAKEDAVFKQQRQANIAEVSRVKEARAKSFGGRKEKPLTKPDFVNTSYNQSNQNFGNESDSNSKQFPDSAKDSPVRNKVYTNEKSRKNIRNDYTQSKQDNPRFQNMGNNNFQSSSLKDNKLENRNKLGDFITQDIKQHTGFQGKFPDSEFRDYTTTSRTYKSSGKDYRSTVEKQPFRNESRNIVNMMEQVKIYGYDVKDRNDFGASDFHLMPGMEVMAKYWEDNQFYRAVVHAVGKEGKTCVVHFLDYGNYEEVLIDDVQDTSSTSSFREKNWNCGPISFQPSPRNNYESHSSTHNQGSRDGPKPYQNTNRGYGRQDGNRAPRTEYRPSVKLYQPPNRRETNT